MSRQAAAEYQALTRALYGVKPPCEGDDRFIAEPDELDDATQGEMRALCRGCDVVDKCIAYASVAKPAAGMWGGRFYGPKNKRGA